MKTLNAILLFAIAIFLLQSCTIEKRRYNSGFHVEWNRNSAGNDKRVESTVVEPTAELERPSDLQVAVVADSVSIDENVPVVDKKEPDTAKINSQIRKENRDVGKDVSKTIPAKRIFAMPIYSAGVNTPSEQNAISEEKKEADEILSIVAFVLALISIGFLFAAGAASGWAILGYIILAAAFGTLCALFALIAYLVAKKRGNPLKWFLIFAIIYGSLWVLLYVLSMLGSVVAL